MRKIFKLSACIVAMFSFVTVFPSCERHGSYGYDDDVIVHPRRDTGKEEGEEQQPKDDLSDYTAMSSAVAYNFGSYWAEGTDNYVLKMHQGTRRSENEFTGKGIELSIDLITVRSTNYEIAEGTYNVTYNEFAPFVFLQGEVNEDGTVEPTYIYRQYSANPEDYDLFPVAAGTVKVSRSGDRYLILCNFEDEDGGKYRYSYEGVIEFKEGEAYYEDEFDYDNIPQNVVVNDFESVEATNLGAIYNDFGAAHNDWEIILYPEDPAAWIGLEIVVGTDGPTDVIPDGTYPVSQGEKLKIGEAVPFVYDADTQTGYGCYYGYGNYYWYWGTKGTVTVRHIENSRYEISFDILSEGGEHDGSFKGTYNGVVGITDKSDTRYNAACSRSFSPERSVKSAAPAAVKAKKTVSPDRRSR